MQYDEHIAIAFVYFFILFIRQTAIYCVLFLLLLLFPVNEILLLVGLASIHHHHHQSLYKCTSMPFFFILWGPHTMKSPNYTGTCSGRSTKLNDDRIV